MRILVVTQYFWPENFRINDLVIALTERGHNVEVLTGKPNYPNGKFYTGYSFFKKDLEVWKSVKIHRAPLFPRGNSANFSLALNYLSFVFFGIIRACFIRGKFDKILVYEPSPVTVGIPAIILKWIKRAPIFFWVQDLWPQSITATSNINNEFIIKLFDRITKWIYSHCDKILIQSEAFRELIQQQGVASDKILYYPNSVENLFAIPQAYGDELPLIPTGFLVMFAGNIGEAQDFDTILGAAKIVASKSTDIKWIILGDGRKRSYVEERIKLFNLEEVFYLMGSFPLEMMPRFYARADCLLVSLKRNYIFSLTIPSKIQSYLACGKPIIASLDGEGAKVVREARAGLVVSTENPEGLAKRVVEIYESSSLERERMGNNGRAFFEGNFERELLVSRLEDILR